MGSLVCLLVGDVVYMLVDSRLIASPGDLLDVPYALAFVLFIGAVLHPSMRGPDRGHPDRQDRQSARTADRSWSSPSASRPC